MSRQIIGVEDAYHIESGRSTRASGFLVPAPGAAPIKFRSTYVDGIYDPPAPAKTFVMQTVPEPSCSPPGRGPPIDVVILPPTTTPRCGRRASWMAAIGDQLSGYGPRAPPLWLPPLEEPVPLTSMLPAGPAPRRWRWPLGELDRPFEMRRDPLIFDAASSARQHGDSRRAKVRQIDCPADLHTVGRHASLTARCQFYCLDYGGGQLARGRCLAHVGSIASALEPERIRRTFGKLEPLLRARRRARAQNGGR